MNTLRNRIEASNNAHGSEDGSLEQRIFEWSALSKSEKEGMSVPLRLSRNYACGLGLRGLQKYTSKNKYELVKVILEAEPKKVNRSVSFAARASLPYDESSDDEEPETERKRLRRRIRKKRRRLEKKEALDLKEALDSKREALALETEKNALKLETIKKHSSFLNGFLLLVVSGAASAVLFVLTRPRR